MQDEKVEINQVKFEEMFCQKKPTPKPQQVEEKKNVPSKPQSQLTGARQQNINIVMKKVKLKLPDLKDALLSYNKNKLSPDICDLLM